MVLLFILRSPPSPLHSGVSIGKWHLSIYEIIDMTFHFFGKKFLQWILVRLLIGRERSFGLGLLKGWQGRRPKLLTYLYINRRQSDGYNICVCTSMCKCTGNICVQRLHYCFSILIGICFVSSVRGGMSPLFTVLKYKRVLYCSDLCYYNKIYKMIW